MAEWWLMGNQRSDKLTGNAVPTTLRKWDRRRPTTLPFCLAELKTFFHDNTRERCDNRKLEQIPHLNVSTNVNRLVLQELIKFRLKYRTLKLSKFGIFRRFFSRLNKFVKKSFLSDFFSARAKWMWSLVRYFPSEFHGTHPWAMGQRQMVEKRRKEASENKRIQKWVFSWTWHELVIPRDGGGIPKVS